MERRGKRIYHHKVLNRKEEVLRVYRNNSSNRISNYLFKQIKDVLCKVSRLQQINNYYYNQKILINNNNYR